MAFASREQISKYLDSLHCSIWGRPFDVIANREDAITFIEDIIVGVEEIQVKDDTDRILKRIEHEFKYGPKEAAEVQSSFLGKLKRMVRLNSQQGGI